MPFKSEKQRRWMWAQKPEMAQLLANEEKKQAQKQKKAPKNRKAGNDKTVHGS